MYREDELFTKACLTALKAIVMSFLHILYQFFIEPLVVLLEYIFSWSEKLIGDSALALIPLSLVVNFLCLPLYRRAEAIRRQTRAREKALEPGLKHIKASFKGDERFMMMQAYYKICHFKPIYALRNSLSLLLQVPFFIAAYVMLSGHPDLQNKSFGIIANLAEPDRLLMVEGLAPQAIAINVLPILMTVINLVSGFVYGRKEASVSDKIQTYGLALVFLVLLYNSASGLVLYWILNQLFSLVKNIVASLRRIPAGEVSPAGETAAAVKPVAGKAYGSFLLGGIFLAVLAGVLIPSAVIHSSPSSFVTLWDYSSPLLHLANSALVAFGAFVFWAGVLYYFSGSKGRRILSVAVWGISLAAIVNYMFFGTGLGHLLPSVIYEVAPSFPARVVWFNLFVVMAVLAFAAALWFKWRMAVKPLQVIMLLVAVVMSLSNCIGIGRQLPAIKADAVRLAASSKPRFPMSKSGHNVVVLMLDQAVNLFLPYLFNEKPELKEKFQGFTYYPNTLSFGAATNTGAPGLFGGYEYTPEEMNKRKDKLLVDKHNEALCLMPRVFSENGYSVTVCDPPYAGYKEPADLSVFDAIPGVKAYNAEAMHIGRNASYQTVWKKYFFCYGLMKISPVVLQAFLSQNGRYCDSSSLTRSMAQVTSGVSVASGIKPAFMDSYAVLSSLPEMTIVQDSGDTFLMMDNNITHEPMLLQEPEFVPSEEVDNTAYDKTHKERFVMDGRVLPVGKEQVMMRYHISMAAMLKLGEWFDYLRAQGLWDNTRIIIVADHGKTLYVYDDMLIGNEMKGDIFSFNPLLMVKDFNATGFTTDYQFMTNADTPTLAFDALIENPVNPFTGKQICSAAKYAGELHVMHVQPGEWNVNKNHEYTFRPGRWCAVSNQDIFYVSNWKYIGVY